MKLRMCLFSAAMMSLLGSSAHAAILYGGGTYSENFNSLPNTPTNASVQATRPWNDDTTQTPTNTSVPGWYLWHPIVAVEGGANGHQRIRYSSGNSNTGSFYSFGTNSTTDRALGMVSSGTLATGAPLPPNPPDNGESYIGVRIRNNTTYVMTNFVLTFTGEQWRDGGATIPNAQSLTFGYKVTSGAANIQDGGFTPDLAGTFVSPVFTNTTTGAAVDGNVAGKGPVQTVTVSGLNWLPNEDLWLRWADINNAGADHGLSIDDVGFEAVPEPGTFVLAGIAIVGMLATRRRQ